MMRPNTKTLQKLAAVAIALLAVMNACQPEPDENPQPGFLTGGSAKTWIITDAKQNGLSHPLKPCLVGDVYVFNADKSVRIDAGTVKCASTDPQTTNGRWDIYGSEITIAESGGQTLVVLKIRSLNGSRLVAELANNNPGVTVEYTFAAQ